MKQAFETYDLPSHWASYLINGDCSGMDDAEIKQVDDWCASHKVGLCVGCDDAEEFKTYHDAYPEVLACSCLGFTFETNGGVK